MPKVVFLPGFMQHADSWSPVAAAAGERYPSKIVDFSTWTFEGRLGEIRRASSSGDVLIGYSMGGRLALHAALREPGRYAGLVLLGASPGIEDEGERRQRRHDDEQLARWMERQPIEVVVERWEGNPVFAGQSDAVVEAQRPARLRHSPADLAWLLRSAGQGALPVVWDRLGELGLPVLALAGEKDGTYRAVGERMRSSMGDCEARVVPGAGHAAHLEQPHAVGEALSEWLAAHSS